MQDGGGRKNKLNAVVGGIGDLGQIDAYFTATLANREDSHAHGKSCMCLGAAAAINITEAGKKPKQKMHAHYNGEIISFAPTTHTRVFK